MADRKITELTALAAGSQATGDLLAIVDVSETASSNKNKKITVESLFKGIPGNVGIGTASPGTKLDVNGAAKANYAIASGGLAAYASSTGGLYSYFASTAGHINAVTDNSGTAGTLIFATGSERLRVDSSGNVGIGTSSPGRKLDVNGIIRSDGTSGGLAFGGNSSTPSEGAAIHRPANNTLAFATNSSERMRIDSSGNVGIGTTSPSTLIHGEASTAELRLKSTGASNSALVSFIPGTQTNPFYVYVNPTRNLIFQDNSTERMRIDSAGRLLLGTTSYLSNTARLIVSGGVASGEFYDAGGCYNTWSSGGTPTARGFIGVANQLASGGSGTDFAVRAQNHLIFTTGGHTERARINSSGAFMVGQTNGSAGTPGVVCNANGTLTVCTSNSTTSIFNHNSGSGNRNMILFRTDGTNRGSITSNGSTTSYNTTSDHRLKENVVDLDGAITRVKQLQPKRFNFIADADTTVDGFLAHEAQTVVPEAVTGAHNEIDDDGNAVMQGIDQSKLVPLLTAALQEAIAEIETLKTKVAALEAG